MYYTLSGDKVSRGVSKKNLRLGGERGFGLVAGEGWVCGSAGS